MTRKESEELKRLKEVKRRDSKRRNKILYRNDLSSDNDKILSLIISIFDAVAFHSSTSIADSALVPSSSVSASSTSSASSSSSSYISSTSSSTSSSSLRLSPPRGDNKNECEGTQLASRSLSSLLSHVFRVMDGDSDGFLTASDFSSQGKS